ncbi:haloacid dehalogenase-like hydrolase [Actinophytocola xanthii]|uniref:Haloacid dehalogenase n=1 Tax=Actinophytocola xanthii TaxID=1912961 RepID=A0A1Q8CSJ2_9PSEU|nr:haloacid dehalogenase-like hydrolase [Actinophytocola xanthii]OLF17306.1 haloacid dehalogenase [Actinophytocola xanthii]
MLWDVDHTLIETRGVGLAIYRLAFPAATGRPLAELAKISGRTELDIIRETLRINGVEPTSAAVDRLATALIQGYEDARAELAGQGRALPGAHDVLTSLGANPAIFQTVLTGNLREVARIKLEVFGLDAFLDLDAGAYGDDHQERAMLVALAQERARQRSRVPFGNDRTVLVGDTPNDVAAGLTAGARVLGIATGKTSLDELRDAGATYTAKDLDEAASLLTTLAFEVPRQEDHPHLYPNKTTTNDGG